MFGTKSGVKDVQVSARIKRADGTIVDLGVISKTNKNKKKRKDRGK